MDVFTRFKVEFDDNYVLTLVYMNVAGHQNDLKDSDSDSEVLMEATEKVIRLICQFKKNNINHIEQTHYSRSF